MMKNNINTESEFISDFLFKEKQDDLSIYIHIPFCEKRCYYCDFCSSTNFSEIDNYFYNLKKEIYLYKDFLKTKNIKSIFIGGGTPSSVNSKYIYEILTSLYNLSNLDSNCEITIEMNPNSITKNKIEDYLSSNINRFSMGIQSFNDNILNTIGRIHTKNQAIKSFELLRSKNINNINFDLMLGLPYQTSEDIEDSLNYIIELNPEHISYYSLILEEGTKLYNDHLKNPLPFANEDLDRNMYRHVVSMLDKMSFKQYEISNFSKLGYESIHNLRYWTLKNYLGFGLNSSSNISELRFKNTSSFKEYYSLIKNNLYPIAFIEKLSTKDRINEFAMMGLRINKGINIKNLENKFFINFFEYYKNPISKNISSKLITIENGHLKLTEKGKDLSNQVELDFFTL